jgi:RNA polymerase sigma-70 factor (ECF subfamily)
MPVQESELIQRVIHMDDQHAFRTLVRLHQASVRGYLRRWVIREEMADEIAQDVFLIAYQKMAMVKGQSLRPWLLTIAYRLACRAHKKTKLEMRTLEASFATEYSEPEVSLARFDLDKVLNRLDRKERFLLTAWAYDGASHRELAERLAEPLGTIKTTIFRARMKLKRWLSQPE